MSKLKKTTVYVKGMHCPSCEVLINDKFREEGNIKEVKPNFRTQKVEVCYVGELHKDRLNQKINQFGYQVLDVSSMRLAQEEPLIKRLTDVGIIAVFLFILYAIAQEAHVLPNFNFSGNLNYFTVFILGLVVSTSTCMATSGALFLATVGKLRKEGASLKENILPATFYNLGRVLSYGFFGFLAGMIGGVLITNFKFGSWLTLIVSLFMVLLGLDMARIISLSSVLPTGLTKGIFEKLEHRLIKNPKKTAFFLGAITYLLPCGFTQTVQVFALGLASPVQSALTMMTFALGTVPALFLIGGFSSLTQSRYYPYFMKVIGIIVFVVGVSYFSNFLSLYGINLNFLSASTQLTVNSNIVLNNGKQVATMNVNNSGYNPNSFTVKKDIPVKWVINGQNVFGCQGYLVAPKLNVQQALAYGQNIIEFTPQEEGVINFSCGMGMYRGQFNVVGG